jgi:DNA-binding transcriptional ArsR family regulator
VGQAVAKIDVFRALADPTRRALLDRLRDEEQPVLALASDFAMSLPAVSQHLKVLRAAGLVAERREGRQRVYRLQAEALREVAEWLAHYERFWNSRLQRLGRHLREKP